MTIKTKVFTERRTMHHVFSVFHNSQYILSESEIPGTWHEPSSNRLGGETNEYRILVIDDENLNNKLMKQFEEAHIKSYLGKWHEISVSFQEKDAMKQRIRHRKWDPEKKTWSVLIDRTNHIYFDLNSTTGHPSFVDKQP